MQLLSTITIQTSRPAVIELMQGDLSALPAEHAADILVISAYPEQYGPSPGTLVEALHKKGLSVEKLSENKMCDLRTQLGCWLSDHLTADQQKQFNFSHILCFEPLLHSEAPEEVVSNIFRCINTFVFEDDHNVVAMPILATGNQNVPVDTMLPALIENAIFWLEQGLPLNAIKLVVYREDQVKTVREIFEKARREYEPPMPTEKPVAPATPPMQARPAAAPMAEAMAPPAPPALPQLADQYDYFISYAHKDTALVNSFVASIQKHNERLKIFYDRSTIPPGGLWIKHISDAIQRARKVIILITPDYINSPVCWDEFQCAKLMEYNTRQPIIQTIYLYSEKVLPPIMGIYSYIDCREGDMQKLHEATRSLSAAIAEMA